MRDTQATFKLGSEFENWGQVSDSYIHSKGPWYLACGFPPFLAARRRNGNAIRDQGLLLRIDGGESWQICSLPQSDVNYAYHLDATRYARSLRSYSEALGAKRVEGKIIEVQQHPETGFIKVLRLDSGAPIEGDLFIDCTGFRSL